MSARELVIDQNLGRPFCRDCETEVEVEDGIAHCPACDAISTVVHDCPRCGDSRIQVEQNFTRYEGERFWMVYCKGCMFETLGFLEYEYGDEDVHNARVQAAQAWNERWAKLKGETT